MAISKEELISRLSQIQNEKTPYKISLRGNTLTLELNLADAKWYMLFSKNKLKRVFKVHVMFDETNHTARIESEDFELEWSAGTPLLGDKIGLLPKILFGNFKISLRRGEQYQFEFARGWGIREDLRSAGQVYSYSLNSVAALRQVKDMIRNSGWKIEKSLTTKLGIYSVIFAILLALLVLMLTI